MTPANPSRQIRIASGAVPHRRRVHSSRPDALPENHDMSSFRQNRGPMRRLRAQPGGIPRFSDLPGEVRGALVIVPKAD